MTNPELQGQIEAARAYEALFVPALMGMWAPVVADAAAIAPGQQVLDVACGTGVLTRTVAAKCAPGGRVTGLDANPGMLAVAAERAPALTWRAGRAETLPFDDGAFDAVVSQFGLMFFEDRVGAIREMLRVLRPDGTLAVAVWDSLANHPAYAAEAALLARMAGDRAAEPLRAPFALGDAAALARLFTDAGADAVEIVTHPGTATFPSVQVVVGADLRGWLPLMGVTLDEAAISEILGAADDALAPYITSSSSGVSFATSVHVVRVRRA